MSKVRILIAEDEEDARKALVRLLGRRGYGGILEASGGADAVNIIEKERPDIVFLDISLADSIDGMEVLRKAMILAPQTKVIMMSAYGPQFEEEAKQLGAYGFLSKPVVDIKLFVNLIEEISKTKI